GSPGVAAREEGDVVAAPDQFFGEMGHHPFGPPVELRRHRLEQGRNLSDTHCHFRDLQYDGQRDARVTALPACLRGAAATAARRRTAGVTPGRSSLATKWADTGTACGIDIETGAQEFEWTNPGNLILFFHRRRADIYLTLNDGLGGG